eukprot:CAMPEP_0174978110 /NCGR_PEP_ID=MMETSP0004_2-20121128/13994_1 /TAXON_ID=420556 /ORGANISM="Ochromonas sp., Strain CCMP1393" /LENGTH=57 /DNA_ID=CAMNT_0016229391 /DNA_START=286 /DNA_END=459 /DNA_ORIENTATION=+
MASISSLPDSSKLNSAPISSSFPDTPPSISSMFSFFASPFTSFIDSSISASHDAAGV